MSNSESDEEDDFVTYGTPLDPINEGQFDFNSDILFE